MYVIDRKCFIIESAWRHILCLMTFIPICIEWYFRENTRFGILKISLLSFKLTGMLELLTTKWIETYFGRSQRSVALGDFRYLKTVVLASFSWQNTCIIHSLFYWWTPITPLQHTCALTCCVISLASRFPQPFPLPSKKRSHEIKKKYPAERARFSRRGKGVGKWIISDQKQLYFEGRSRHLLAQLSRCYKKIKGGFFCHLKSVSGSKKKVCCSVCDF